MQLTPGTCLCMMLVACSHAPALFLRSSAACTADIVLLQEVWVAADVELLRQAGAEGRLPHSFHYSSGTLGCGLVLLSRFPISEVRTQPAGAQTF